MKNFRQFFFYFAFAIFSLLAAALQAEEPSVTVTGKVVLVKTISNQLLLAFKKPGADMETISSLQIDGKTVFKNISNLAQLRIHDDVTVRYLLDGAGNLLALEVEKKAASAAQAESDK